MPTIGNTFLDLIDVYKRQSGDGQQIATIIELLKQTNPILDDAIAVEANNGTKHRTTVRTGLPPITWGMLYKGIAQSKSTTAQVEDATGMAEALSTVDKRLLDLSNNESALRLSEAKAFLELMNQEVAKTVFYGNSAQDPEQFTGLTPRFSSLTAPNGGQIVDASSGTALTAFTSIWFVTWGEQQAHLIYPKGTKAGVSREDKGEQRVQDSAGNPYFVKEELFRWHVGLSVRDWRYLVRIANIPIDANGNILFPGGPPSTFKLLDFLRRAYWKLHAHRISGGNTVIYANATVCEKLDLEVTPTDQGTGYIRLTPDTVTGKEVMSYRGIPIRQCDAITLGEAKVL